ERNDRYNDDDDDDGDHYDDDYNDDDDDVDDDDGDNNNDDDDDDGDHYDDDYNVDDDDDVDDDDGDDNNDDDDEDGDDYDDDYNDDDDDDDMMTMIANALVPGSIKKPNSNPGKMSFKMMENIGWFVEFITSYGVQQEYIFVTVDLYEKQNVWQSRVRMSGKPTARSYGHGTESKTSIQPITARIIIAQPTRMLGYGMVTARHEPYRN
ncbi:hypothetical protein QZH41_016020, partial [Actinostola sp. cb2023]